MIVVGSKVTVEQIWQAKEDTVIRVTQHSYRGEKPVSKPYFIIVVGEYRSDIKENDILEVTALNGVNRVETFKHGRKWVNVQVHCDFDIVGVSTRKPKAEKADKEIRELPF